MTCDDGTLKQLRAKVNQTDADCDDEVCSLKEFVNRYLWEQGVRMDLAAAMPEGWPRKPPIRPSE